MYGIGGLARSGLLGAEDQMRSGATRSCVSGKYLRQDTSQNYGFECSAAILQVRFEDSASRRPERNHRGRRHSRLNSGLIPCIFPSLFSRSGANRWPSMCISSGPAPPKAI